MKKNKKQFEKWFEIGSSELGFAKLGLEESDEFYAQICIQAHQAIEKFLKGFLNYNNFEHPKTHDLSRLVEECSKFDKNFNDFWGDCEKVSSYYVDLRYPVHYEQKTRKQAEKAVEVAERVKKFIKNKINKEK